MSTTTTEQPKQATVYGAAVDLINKQLDAETDSDRRKSLARASDLLQSLDYIPDSGSDFERVAMTLTGVLAEVQATVSKGRFYILSALPVNSRGDLMAEDAVSLVPSIFTPKGRKLTHGDAVDASLVQAFAQALDRAPEE